MALLGHRVVEGKSQRRDGAEPGRRMLEDAGQQKRGERCTGRENPENVNRGVFVGSRASRGSSFQSLRPTSPEGNYQTPHLFFLFVNGS